MSLFNEKCKGAFTLKLFSARLMTVTGKLFDCLSQPIGNRNFPVTVMSRSLKRLAVSVPSQLLVYV